MSFKAEVDAWIAETEQRLVTVGRSAIGDLVNEAQTSVGKGGKMPVDTGFLRASGLSNLNSLPAGPSQKQLTTPLSYPSPDDYTTQGKVAVDLARMTLNDTFYFGWTAQYASKIEVRYGFVEGAVQNWQSHVTKRAEELMRRSGK